MVTRRKANTTTPRAEKIPEETFKCLSCGKDLKKSLFYKSYDAVNTLNIIPYCKNCIKKMVVDNNGIIDMNKFKLMLEKIDRPFLYDYWESSLNGKADSLGIYMKNLGLVQNRNLRWKDSVHEKIEKNKNEASIQTNEDTNKMSTNLAIEELKDKFGDGYPDGEYYLFEKKYQQLRPSAKILTTFHDEFFKEYCVDKVKETLAKSKGDFKEAKEWASMAKDAATAGKLNPNQMSKSDLTGGMDTFGQMTKMVEETPQGELQKILPKFIERPKDKVDVVLWCYVNYVRDLKGLPACEYKDIYEFYEIRKNSYEKQMLDNEDTQEGDDSNV